MITPGFRLRGTHLERGNLSLQLRGGVLSTRPRLRIAALPALVLGSLDGVIDCA
jgi:hypothetical protein